MTKQPNSLEEPKPFVERKQERIEKPAETAAEQGISIH